MPSSGLSGMGSAAPAFAPNFRLLVLRQPADLTLCRVLRSKWGADRRGAFPSNPKPNSWPGAGRKGELLFLSRGSMCLSRSLAIPPKIKVAEEHRFPTVGRVIGSPELREKTGKVLSFFFLLLSLPELEALCLVTPQTRRIALFDPQGAVIF